MGHRFFKILIILCALLLAACANNNISYTTAATLQSDAAHIKLLKNQITSTRATIVETKDTVLLVLPDVAFFNPDSANLQNDAYYSLDKIVDLFGYYEKSVVQVVGFTGSHNAPHIKKVLAAARAQKIAQYLWNNGIDANFIYADGQDQAVTSYGRIILRDCVLINFKKLPKN
jgi:outer membrane protein OmpA-like peptidoglycan-associated protein